MRDAFGFSIISLAQAMGTISWAMETFMFMTGMWFTWKAITGFSQASNSSPNQRESPWSNLFWGGIFAISANVIASILTTFNGGTSPAGISNPFAYTPTLNNTAAGYAKDVILAVLTILRFFGYWFMMKGFLLLKEITDGSHSSKQHSPAFAGMTHIIFSAVLIAACDNNSPLGEFLGINTSTGGSGKTLSQTVSDAVIAIKEPALMGFGMAGLTVGAFMIFSGIRNFSQRSSGAQQKTTVADDLKLIASGGALSTLGGVAGMSAETMARIFSS